MTYTGRSAPVFDEVEFRAAKDGTTTFEGYVAKFESPSKEIFDPKENPFPFIETISPRAFARSLGRGQRHAFVVDHDDRLHISSTDGQLRLGEDSVGLIATSPWPRTDYTDNVRALHESGEPLGMSFTFKPSRSKTAQEWDANRRARRLNEVSLGHVTVLASMVPAYNETTASFRALAYRMETEVDDLDTLFEALKEGRELTDDEKVLLRKLAEIVEPNETPETPDPVEEPEARTDVLAKWKSRLEEITAA